MKCKICENSGKNTIFHVREMMFGFRDIFEYLECSKCGCLQLMNIPADMSKYYPNNYYSFKNRKTGSRNILTRIAKKCRNEYAVFKKCWVGKILFSLFPDNILRIIGEAGIDKNSKILDVGAGYGDLLDKLKQLGFNELLGIDLYIEDSIKYEHGLSILKKSIYDISGKWDAIIFIHSFEHMAEPLKTLYAAHDLLSPDGTCILEIPTVSSYAWRHYRVDWVQVDAPRHIFLYSIESIKILAAMAGFRVEKLIYNSFDFQFWGSEQYKNDIPLESNRSYLKNPAHSLFSTKIIRKFKKEAEDLNKKQDGDSVVICLKRI